MPFKVRAMVIEVSDRKVDYKISLKCNFSSKVFAQNMVMRIPTPLNTASCDTRCTAGRAKYKGAENCIVWKISKAQGGDDLQLNATALLTELTVKKAWSRPPVTLDFQVFKR